MSGSSLDGLDMAYVHFNENAGKWSFEIVYSECIPYDQHWRSRLTNSTRLSAVEYLLLHSDYGHYLAERVNGFIDKNELQHKVDIIVSHGHTTFHLPAQRMTAQLGDGAALTADTQLPVVTDLRSIDVAFGGQGAPIVPVGEKLLFPGIGYFLNLGGIANLSSLINDDPLAFDICAANRVLNLLAQEIQLDFDKDGQLAATGKINDDLLNSLNDLSYYDLPHPKSLPNSFGTDEVYPLIKKFDLPLADALRTYVEHIVIQVKNALIKTMSCHGSSENINSDPQLLITGGGALNSFLIARLKDHLLTTGIDVVVPQLEIINYKEALIIALIGTLRWREEYNVIASVTGARRNSIGGALWLGTEA
jgi:Predicted molecular chaperone distantly related to HSP70-fold metalloproteases